MAIPVQIRTIAQWMNGSRWRAELLHSRDHHVFVWLTRGQGRCLIDGLRRGLGVHNALAIPAGTSFSLNIGTQGFGLVCTLPAGGPILMPDSAQLLRIRDAQLQTELNTIFEAMQREQNANRPFLDEAMTAQAHLLTVWLRRAMIEYPAPAQRVPAAERLVRAFCALLELEFRSGKPMADYAAALGVTPTHLTRSCRQCAGMTAADMITERSLYEARTLLERGQLPIRQVAAELGFNSAAYFSRFIQQHTGQTPSALRKRSRLSERIG